MAFVVCDNTTRMLWVQSVMKTPPYCQCATGKFSIVYGAAQFFGTPAEQQVCVGLSPTVLTNFNGNNLIWYSLRYDIFKWNPLWNDYDRHFRCRFYRSQTNRNGIKVKRRCRRQGHSRDAWNGKWEKRQVKSVKLPMGELCPCRYDRLFRMRKMILYFRNDIYIWPSIRKSIPICNRRVFTPCGRVFRLFDVQWYNFTDNPHLTSNSRLNRGPIKDLS